MLIPYPHIVLFLLCLSEITTSEEVEETAWLEAAMRTEGSSESPEKPRGVTKARCIWTIPPWLVWFNRIFAALWLGCNESLLSTYCTRRCAGRIVAISCWWSPLNLQQRGTSYVCPHRLLSSISQVNAFMVVDVPVVSRMFCIQKHPPFNSTYCWPFFCFFFHIYFLFLFSHLRTRFACLYFFPVNLSGLWNSVGCLFFYYSLTIPINSYLRLFWIYSIKFVMRSAAVPRSVSLVSSVVLRLKISHTQRTFSLHCHSFTVYWCQTQFHLCICVIPHNCSVCTQCVSSEQMKWWCRKGLQAVKVHLSVEGNHLFWASWPNLWFEYARQKWLKSGT